MTFFRTIVLLLLSCVILCGDKTNGFPNDVLIEEADPPPDPCLDFVRNHPGTDNGEDDKVTQLLNLAHCYSRQGKWDSAHENAEEVLKLDPDNVMALIYRGHVFLRTESERRALEDLLRARRLADVQNAPVKVKLEAFKWLMKTHGAINGKEPLFTPSGRMMRVRTLEEDAQWRLMANPCVSGDESRLPTRDTTAFMSVGNRYFYEFMFDEALICYNKIINMDHSVAMHYTNRALCHMRREDWKSAADDVERAVSLQPDNVRALFYSGYLNFKLAKYDVALDSLDRALQLADTSDVPPKEQEQMFALTEQVCGEAVKTMPDNLKIVTILSRTLIKEQFYDLAIDLLIEGLDKVEVNNASSDEKKVIQNLLDAAREKLFTMSKDGPQIERNNKILFDEMRNQIKERSQEEEDPLNVTDHHN